VRGPLPGPLREGYLFQPTKFASGDVVHSETKSDCASSRHAPATSVTKGSDETYAMKAPNHNHSPETIPAEDLHQVNQDESTLQAAHQIASSKEELSESISPLFSRLGMGVAPSSSKFDGCNSSSMYDDAATDAAVLAVRDALGKIPTSLKGLADFGSVGNLVARIRLGVPQISKETGFVEDQHPYPTPTIEDESKDRAAEKAMENSQLLSLRKVDLTVIERSIAPFARLQRPIRVSLGGLSDLNDFQEGNVCVIAAVTVGHPRERSPQSLYEKDTLLSPILQQASHPSGISSEGLYPSINAPLTTLFDAATHKVPLSPQVSSFFSQGHPFVEGSSSQFDMAQSSSSIEHLLNKPAQRIEPHSMGTVVEDTDQKKSAPQLPQWAEVFPMLPAQQNLQEQVSKKRPQEQVSSLQKRQKVSSSNQGAYVQDTHTSIRQKHPEYHDHIDEVPTKPELAQFGELIRSLKLLPFPLRLHRLLDEHQSSSTCGHSGAFGWLSHGRAFRVYDVPSFVSEVLPEHFRLTKYCSFLRQLNLYGFRRIGTGPDRGSYYHELFLRGMPVLASRMRRTRVNGNGTRRAADPDTEPDFYVMPPVPRALPMKVDDDEEDEATTEMKERLGEVSTVLQAEAPRHFIHAGTGEASDAMSQVKSESEYRTIASSLINL